MKTNPAKTNPCPTRRGIPTGHSGRNLKSSRAWLAMLGAASLMLPSSLNAQTLLAGFYDAGADSGTAVTRAANELATGITAEWFGATRGVSVGSTDGFYGSTAIAAPTTTLNNGAYRGNVANTITITNTTGSDVSLESLVFDYHNNGNTTRDYWDILTLTYVSGDLGVTDGTVINTVSGLARDTTNVNSSDYNDFSWSLTGLADFTLANGQSAVFSLISTYTDTAAANPNNFSALDNIGFIGTVGAFVDDIPPVWAATYPKADTETTDGFTIRAKTNENGTAYYQILADGAPTPTAAAVKAAPTGTIALTANTEGTALITGLSVSTPYDVYVVAEDALANLQADPLPTVNVSTASPDVTAPNWALTYPQADTQTADGFTARAQIDENGTVFYVVVADGATAPTPAEVQAGTGSGGSGQLASGNFAVTANVEGTALVSGLTYTPGSLFDVYFVAVDGSSNATASTLVNWNPDTTAPSWTSGYPLVDTVTEQGFTVRASIAGEGGKAYYVVLADGASPPSAAQVKAGQDANGDPALNDSINAIVADTEKSKAVVGLLASTAYDVYVVIEDALFNLSAPVLRDVTTLAADLTVPTWTATYPKVDTVTSSGFTVRASIDEAGTAYYVVLANNSTAPSDAQIIAGTDGSNATALKSGNFTLAANTENSAVVTGLADGTDYDIYIVAVDNAVAANTTAVEFREATTPVSTLTVIGNVQWNDNADRVVSVYPGNSYIQATLGDGTLPDVAIDKNLGTVVAYNFVNSNELNPDAIQSYSSLGTEISLPTTIDTGLLNTTRCATGVYTVSDPTGGVPDYSADTTVSGIEGSVDGTIDVTGLASGTLYFIIGSGGAEGRATSLTITQGPSTVVTAQSGGGYYQSGGTSFWANSDTIAACVEVAFTNDGSNNTITYSYDQSSAGSFMGVVLSTAGGGGYTDWANANVGGQPADGDFNFDGVDNGIAYFMDDTGVITLPGIVDGSITWVNGGNIPSGDYGTQFKVQTSTDLATWTDILSGDGNLTNAAGSVAYTLPTGAGKLFARLVVDPD